MVQENMNKTTGIKLRKREFMTAMNCVDSVEEFVWLQENALQWLQPLPGQAGQKTRK